MASVRTRLDVDVRREQLLDAGVELFARRSWEEVSIDGIAAACGVSRGLLYHYFKGKREFYVASVERAVQRLHEEIEPELTLPPTAQLLTGLQRHFAGIEQHADAHTLLLGVAAADEEVAAIVARDREAFAQRVLAGMPGAGGSSPLARATARAWIGSVEAATRELIASDGDVTAEQLVAVLAESLVAALLAAARLDASIEVPPGIDGLAGGGIVEAIVASWSDDPPGERPGGAEQPVP
ncbi:TetR/AcrR family transcriptional regulator [Conexibacter sp. JD483]|uniref:TetR/AcrR family transcriptional regulator n=1 Tax=unclassified Conexibacter TaxID=2627773 RepID=UPI00271D6A5F|nr:MULTISPECIES: TetR/AcrR family transcriptional regulator [unclassified Conexibacter]MDO8184600.1 TetR/AcrR family transcriptional regulator [Conexibacter sp. CPCC 205706]MDO8197906.1 TetR/AcrR family transcriptional regulator [Conexibacter sp. CPCC 205762]MDR9370129.1 TetR/AcrR family transcriptional regulator [Conexibacter sp. JD483]